MLDHVPDVGRHRHRDHRNDLLGARVDLVDHGGALVRDPERSGHGDHAAVEEHAGDRHPATLVEVRHVDPAQLADAVILGRRPDLAVQVRRPETLEGERVHDLGRGAVDPDQARSDATAGLPHRAGRPGQITAAHQPDVDAVDDFRLARGPRGSARTRGAVGPTGYRVRRSARPARRRRPRLVEGSFSRRGSRIFGASGTAVGWPGAGVHGGSSGGGRMAPDPVKVEVALSASGLLDVPAPLQAAVRLTLTTAAITRCARIKPPGRNIGRPGSGRRSP